MSKAVFITGTGTDMGKTYLSGLIVKKLAQAGKNPAYYKAAMSASPGIRLPSARRSFPLIAAF